MTMKTWAHFTYLTSHTPQLPAVPVTPHPHLLELSLTDSFFLPFALLFAFLALNNSSLLSFLASHHLRFSLGLRENFASLIAGVRFLPRSTAGLCGGYRLAAIDEAATSHRASASFANRIIRIPRRSSTASLFGLGEAEGEQADRCRQLEE